LHYESYENISGRKKQKSPGPGLGAIASKQTGTLPGQTRRIGPKSRGETAACGTATEIFAQHPK
jgi:hypothetical protein